MCGIVGYVGKRNAQDVLLDGLEKLEYRGYDSAGVALALEGGIRVSRARAVWRSCASGWRWRLWPGAAAASATPGGRPTGSPAM